MLLNARADLNASDFKGVTALHWAAFYGQVSLVRMLLAARGNVAAKNIRGASAQELAAENGHGDVLLLLKEAQRPRAPQSGHKPTAERKRE